MLHPLLLVEVLLRLLSAAAFSFTVRVPPFQTVSLTAMWHYCTALHFTHTHCKLLPLACFAPVQHAKGNDVYWTETLIMKLFVAPIGEKEKERSPAYKQIRDHAWQAGMRGHKILDQRRAVKCGVHVMLAALLYSASLGGEAEKAIVCRVIRDCEISLVVALAVLDHWEAHATQMQFSHSFGRIQVAFKRSLPASLIKHARMVEALVLARQDVDA